MRKPLLVAMMVALSLGGCASVRSSRLNPFNWFGGSTQKATDKLAAVAQVSTEHRPLVDTVESLVIEKIPGGAIVRATGLSATQGYWDAALISDTGNVAVNGVLTYRFVISPPAKAAAVSTPQSREVTVARYLTTIELDSVREITVVGASNSRSSRR